MISLAALLGVSLVNAADTTNTTSNQFLDDEKAQILRNSAKAACHIYKDLTYFDLTPMASRDPVSGVAIDQVVSLTSARDIILYGTNA